MWTNLSLSYELIIYYLINLNCTKVPMRWPTYVIIQYFMTSTAISLIIKGSKYINNIIIINTLTVNSFTYVLLRAVSFSLINDPSVFAK